LKRGWPHGQGLFLPGEKGGKGGGQVFPCESGGAGAGRPGAGPDTATGEAAVSPAEG